MRALLPFALLISATSAVAFDPPKQEEPPEGIPLVITIVDAQSGKPIPFATIRETQEKTLKMVDRATGQLALTRLEPTYNDMVPLEKGMTLTIEVTAAAYEPRQVEYTMRRRRNRLLIPLSPMKIAPNIGSEPVLQFGRDRPLDGQDLPSDEVEQMQREMRPKRETAD